MFFQTYKHLYSSEVYKVNFRVQFELLVPLKAKKCPAALMQCFSFYRKLIKENGRCLQQSPTASLGNNQLRFHPARSPPL